MVGSQWGWDARVLSLHWCRDRYLCLVEGAVVDPRPGKPRAAAVDLGALVRSALAPGLHWIFSCTCGEPCCAGITEPVEVVHRDGEILWYLASRPGIWMRFPAGAYQRDVRAALAASLVRPRGGEHPHGILGLSTEALRGEAARLLEAVG